MIILSFLFTLISRETQVKCSLDTVIIFWMTLGYLCEYLMIKYNQPKNGYESVNKMLGMLNVDIIVKELQTCIDVCMHSFMHTHIRGIYYNPLTKTI